MKTIKCFGKEYLSVKSLADEYNLSDKTLYTRLHRGYTPEEAVTINKILSKQHSKNNLYHIPLCKSEVIYRLKKCGYDIIDYTYKNNQTRMLCYDKDGYKVLISLCSAETGAQAIRFSPIYNKENYLYNINLYIKKNNYNNIALDWRIGKNNKQPEVLFQCKCGNTFWRNFNLWKNKKYHLCHKCSKNTSIYEIEVENFLTDNHIEYIRQQRFKDCKYKKCLPFDFYLPKYNICIEVDGEQHFDKNRIFSYHTNKEQDFQLRIKLDNIKTQYCHDNNIKLLRLPYFEFDNNKNYQKLILNILNT